MAASDKESLSKLDISDISCSSVSPDENMSQHENINNMKVMKHFVRHKLSLSAITDTYELMDKATTKHFIRKNLESSLQLECFYYIKCKTCKLYKGFKSTTKKKCCIDCFEELKPKETIFFTYIPQQQLIKSIGNNYDSIMEFYNENRNKSDDNIRDIYDGKICKEILSDCADQTVPLPLVINTDGIKICNVGNNSLWPILVYQNALPPNIRYHMDNILVIGLYYGLSKEMDIHNIMMPICEELNDLASGFVHEKYVNITFKPMVTHAALDLPAKSKMQCFKQHNSKYACSVCPQKGCAVKNKKNNRSTIRHLYEDADLEIRDNIQTEDIMINLKPNEILGILGTKDISPLISIPFFKIIDSFGIDYLHCVLKGVLEKLEDLWYSTDNKNEGYYISKSKKEILNKRINGLKTTTEIGKIRTMEYLKNFKAREQRNFLLYIYPIALEGVLNTTYLNHFKLVSDSVYILLKSNIRPSEVDACEHKLEEFVKQFQVLYGKSSITINIHSLRHLVFAVRNLGPLWSFSTFAFESKNGVLKKYIKGPASILSQITKKYILNASLCESVEILPKNIQLMGARKLIYLNANFKNAFDLLQNINESIYVNFSIKKKSTKFTSTLYRETKSIDYFILFKGNTVGKSIFYFAHEEKISALIEIYTSTESGHFLRVESSKKYILKSVDDIEHKLLYLNYKFGITSHKEYVCVIPNYYEST